MASPKQSQYDALLEERIETLEEQTSALINRLTERIDNLEETVESQNERLDKASQAFAELKKQGTHRTSRSTRQTRFSCTVDGCKGHAVESTVAKHQAASK